LLTARDLKVRYSTSALGYLWSILDPLLMSLIYWFVFTQVFQRPAGTGPYIVFLLSALLPWMWFNSAVGDSTRAFINASKLVRSTSLPRTVWVNRIVLAKGVEFLLALPVLAVFAFFTGAQLTWYALLFPLAIATRGSISRPRARGAAHFALCLLCVARDLRHHRPTRRASALGGNKSPHRPV
jgi:ABC-2 type transport system permease protein